MKARRFRHICFPGKFVLCLVLFSCTAPANQAETRHADALPETMSDWVDSAYPCPEGLSLWPSGGCGPRVDECTNPWELPLVGGGCLPVGPRGCPNSWGRDATADCRAGEFLECAPGFQPSSDGAFCEPVYDECAPDELPLLGGGCVPVGPQWSELEGGEPTFDQCQPNHLALPGGGCRLAGPRSCPDLWGATGPGDCKPGDVRPCRAGWVPGPEELYCVPAFVPPTYAGSCPTGFPDPPADALGVAYVEASSACTNDCGTEGLPFSSIQAAVDHLPEGGAALVAAGEYDGGLVIDKGVQIVGACRTGVVLTTPEESEADPDVPLSDYLVTVDSPEPVRLSNLTVLAPAGGFYQTGSGPVELESVTVVARGGEAVRVTPGSLVALADCRVVVAGEAKAGVVVDGGSAVLEETAIVRDPDCTGGGTTGIAASGGADVEIRYSHLWDHTQAGVLARDAGTVVELVESSVAGPVDGPEQDAGFGVDAGDEAKVVIKGCALDGCSVSAILACDGANVQVQGSVMINTRGDTEHEHGHGARAVSGGAVRLTRTVVERDRDVGVVVEGLNSSLELDTVSIRHIREGRFGFKGKGLQVAAGATVKGSQLLVEECKNSGVEIANRTVADFEYLVVRGIKVDESGLKSRGVHVESGSQVRLRQCVIQGNESRGLIVGAEGAVVEMDRCALIDNYAGPDGFWGQGAVIGKGGLLVASGLLVSGNTENGIALQSSDSLLELTDSIIRNTKGLSWTGAGVGLYAEFGGEATVRHTLIESNPMGGVVVAEGSKLVMADSVVRNNFSDSSQKWGLGVAVQFGSDAWIDGCLIEGNQDHGLGVTHEHSYLDLRRSTIRNTRANDAGYMGYGVLVKAGATATVNGAVIIGNTFLGMGVVGEGSQATVRSSVVGYTKPDKEGYWGRGVEVAPGSRLTLAGTLITDNYEVGLFANISSDALDVAGTIVRNNRANTEFGFGGIVASGKAFTARFNKVLVADNDTMGISISTSESAQVWLTDTAVLRTRKGGAWVMTDGDDGKAQEYQVFGDGISVTGDIVASLVSVVVQDNARCGAYFYESSGGLLNSVLSRNGGFGLALENCEGNVNYQDVSNFILGNALDLPEAQAADISVNPTGLPAPPTPTAGVPQ